MIREVEMSPKKQEESNASGKESWLRINERENAIDFLEKAALFLGRGDDSNQWKWVVISLFNALYGFLICAIQGTNPDRVNIYDHKKKQYTDKLIGFDEALRRAQEERCMKQYIHSKTLTLTSAQRQCIKVLHKTLRNNFEHFVPTAWSIETSGMPEITRNVLDVIEFLALESGNPILNLHQRKRIEECIRSSRNVLFSKANN
jgi:hypothetical protein